MLCQCSYFYEYGLGGNNKRIVVIFLLCTCLHYARWLLSYWYTVEPVKSSTCLRAPHSSSLNALCTLYETVTCLREPVSAGPHGGSLIQVWLCVILNRFRCIIHYMSLLGMLRKGYYIKNKVPGLHVNSHPSVSTHMVLCVK